MSNVSAGGRDLDHFSLLGVPRAFSIDRERLDAAWREAQASVHPDRFATAGDAERRVAMQWASRVNEAYRVLRSPLARARYLCESAGQDVQAENNTAMSPAFLMQQMAWRESLEAAESEGSDDALAAVADEIDAARDAMERDVATLLDAHPPQVDAAVPRVREWMFLERLAEQVDSVRY